TFCNVDPTLCLLTTNKVLCPSALMKSGIYQFRFSVCLTQFHSDLTRKFGDALTFSLLFVFD
ncbi:MAG: hypothetical protein MUP68_10530, partial [Deltaproteobacteria bacterium]|nr:hypothetical protein [Deltaproteobacteria bacterium]